jgi:hypothetical protein
MKAEEKGNTVLDLFGVVFGTVFYMIIRPLFLLISAGIVWLMHKPIQKVMNLPQKEKTTPADPVSPASPPTSADFRPDRWADENASFEDKNKSDE